MADTIEVVLEARNYPVNKLSEFSDLHRCIIGSVRRLFHPNKKEQAQSTHDRHHTPIIDPDDKDVNEQPSAGSDPKEGE